MLLHASYSEESAPHGYSLTSWTTFWLIWVLVVIFPPRTLMIFCCVPSFGTIISIFSRKHFNQYLLRIGWLNRAKLIVLGHARVKYLGSVIFLGGHASLKRSNPTHCSFTSADRFFLGASNSCRRCHLGEDVRSQFR